MSALPVEPPVEEDPIDEVEVLWLGTVEMLVRLSTHSSMIADTCDFNWR